MIGTMMRFVVLAAGMFRCTGHYTAPIAQPDAQAIDDAQTACTGALFDPCTSTDQCASGLCKNYAGAGFTVCSQACTMPGTASCPDDASGSAAFCNNMGLCKPARPNACTR